MGIAARAEALSRAGRGLEARALIDDAVHRGDPEALLMVAIWRLYGSEGPRDWPAAHRLIDRAVAQGHAPALTLKATLTANGTGVAADWGAAQALLTKAAKRDPVAKQQLAMLASIGDASPDGPPQRALPKPEILCDAPDIRLYRRAFTAAECAWLIAAATPEIRPSLVLDPVTGRSTPNPIRRAGASNFGPEREDMVVRSIGARLARLSGTTLAQAEPLAVLRYLPGDEYRPHLDTLPGVSNQRSVTVLTYLNDGYTGGATCFTELGITVDGKRGDALIFTNLDSDGRPDARTRHAGEPVTKGTKWLCSRWIRSAPHDSWNDK